MRSIKRVLVPIGVFAGMMAAAMSAEHVIMVSIDGFRPAAIDQLRADGELPNFGRLQAEGVWTHNARTDFDYTFTVPNHVSMVTGRGVNGAAGHNYTSNGTPSAATTLHTNKGSYVHSVFDVAHDNGLATSVHRSKSKLVIIDQSFSATTGADDMTGEDDGQAKIDIARFNETDRQAGVLMGLIEDDFLATPVNLAFVHFVDPDRQGHGSNWEMPDYFDAVRRIDGYLGRLIDLVENNEPYAGRTTIILTADHGGIGSSHSDETNAENYVIPFYVWGADVPVAGDLYEFNSTTRLDPAGGRPDYAASRQPIRNGDMGNLALDLLGLPAIPGSTINASHDLRVAMPPPGIPQLLVRRLATGSMQIRWAAETAGTVQVTDDLGAWADAPGAWPSEQRWWVDPDVVSGARFYRVSFD